MFKKLLVALSAAALVAVPVAAQRVQTLPSAAALDGSEKIVATQGTGCATSTTPCSAVSVTPAVLGTYLGATFQPLDADLSGIAALSTQAFGRSLLTQASASAAQSALGLAAVASTGLDTSLTGAAWTAYPSTMGCSTGTLTSSGGVGRYKRIGKTVMIQLRLTVTTLGSCAGTLNASLPIAAAATGSGVSTDGWILSGREDSLTGTMLQAKVQQNTSTAYIFTYNNNNPAANGAVLLLTGIYEGA
jgi:hypothetical protein